MTQCFRGYESNCLHRLWAPSGRRPPSICLIAPYLSMQTASCTCQTPAPPRGKGADTKPWIHAWHQNTRRPRGATPECGNHVEAPCLAATHLLDASTRTGHRTPQKPNACMRDHVMMPEPNLGRQEKPAIANWTNLHWNLEHVAKRASVDCRWSRASSQNLLPRFEI